MANQEDNREDGFFLRFTPVSSEPKLARKITRLEQEGDKMVVEMRGMKKKFEEILSALKKVCDQEKNTRKIVEELNL